MPRRRRNQPEEQLQRAVAAFLDVALPEDAVWFHVPNGGARTKAEAGIFKAMGVKAGVPDVLILWRGQLYCIELKAPGRSLSPGQRDMRDRLLKSGAEWGLAKTVGEVAIACAGCWNMPLRASLGDVA